MVCERCASERLIKDLRCGTRAEESITCQSFLPKTIQGWQVLFYIPAIGRIELGGNIENQAETNRSRVLCLLPCCTASIPQTKAHYLDCTRLSVSSALPKLPSVCVSPFPPPPPPPPLPAELPVEVTEQVSSALAKWHDLFCSKACVGCTASVRGRDGPGCHPSGTIEWFQRLEVTAPHQASGNFASCAWRQQGQTRSQQAQARLRVEAHGSGGKKDQSLCWALHCPTKARASTTSGQSSPRPVRTSDLFALALHSTKLLYVHSRRIVQPLASFSWLWQSIPVRCLPRETVCRVRAWRVGEPYDLRLLLLRTGKTRRPNRVLRNDTCFLFADSRDKAPPNPMHKALYAQCFARLR